MAVSIFCSALLSGPVQFSTQSVSSPTTGLSLSGVAAAVVPPEDAALQSSVLPLTLVAAQPTPYSIPVSIAPATPESAVLFAAMAPLAEPTTAPPPVVYVIYTVQEGDTVAGIASNYSISPMSVIWNNIDLENADMLTLGQYLRVPTSDGIIYDVRLGDTLLDIADQFDVEVSAITAYPGNNLAGVDIRESQVIFVPDGKMPDPTPAVPAATPTAEPAPPPALPTTAPPPPPPSEETPEPPSDTSDGFIWPAYGPISGYFGPSHPLGIDLDMFNNPGGAIVASASGVVTFAGGDACCSYGLYVIIDHQNGFETVYAHFGSMTVVSGEYVTQGQVIGYIGLTGRTTGYHLHFEVRQNGANVNPLNYLP